MSSATSNWQLIHYNPALMRRTALKLLLGLTLLAACRLAWAEPKTYDYGGGGRWTAAPAPQTQRSQVVTNPTLDRAEQLLTGRTRNPEDAKDLLVDWLKAHPSAPDRDRAIYLLGEADYQLDDRIKAFYQLDELLDKYPDSRFYRPALEKQYQIADAFLNGHKTKLLGIGFLRVLSADDEAIDMLFRLQERSPGSAMAERCLLRTADFYFSTSQFDLASDAYAAYVRSYPRGSQLPRVRLRQALSSYAQFRGVRFDATALIDARAQFEDIKNRYPELAADNHVQTYIDQINSTLARKMLVTADFYRRTDKITGAVYTLRQLISTYPSSKEAQTAKGELARMPAWALRAPMPATSRPAEPPTTAPSEQRRPAPQFIPTTRTIIRPGGAPDRGVGH